MEVRKIMDSLFQIVMENAADYCKGEIDYKDFISTHNLHFDKFKSYDFEQYSILNIVLIFELNDIITKYNQSSDDAIECVEDLINKIFNLLEIIGIF